MNSVTVLVNILWQVINEFLALCNELIPKLAFVIKKQLVNYTVESL